MKKTIALLLVCLTLGCVGCGNSNHGNGCECKECGKDEVFAARHRLNIVGDENFLILYKLDDVYNVNEVIDPDTGVHYFMSNETKVMVPAYLPDGSLKTSQVNK